MRCLVGDKTSWSLACAKETSSASDWWRGRRTPIGPSTGIALPGEWAAGCPSPAAWWQGRGGHRCGADLSPWWGSHNIGERAAVIPNLTAGDVVSSSSLRIRRETFFPSRAGGWQRCFSESPFWLCCESLPVSLAEVRVGTRFPRWGWGMTRKGDGYGEVITTKGGEGGPRHIGKDMPRSGEEGWPWEGEEGWPWEGRRVGRFWFPTASCELLIAASSASSLASALSTIVLKNQDGWWALKSPNTIWYSRSTRRASKSVA